MSVGLRFGEYRLELVARRLAFYSQLLRCGLQGVSFRHERSELRFRRRKPKMR